MTPTPKPGILDIAPYVGGHGPSGGDEGFKLSSNESAIGPSPEAIAAFDAARGSLHLYPDGGANLLRETIGDVYGLNPERIVCGNGSGEILTLLADSYLRPGDEVMFSAHAFLLYRIATLANSAVPVVVPEKNLRVDVDAMLKAVSPRTRIVFLPNPNNPTGSYLTSEEVRRLHAGLPPSTLFVIDAAYAEYVRRNDYDSGIELVSQFENVVVTRTLSKVYGLAALRVGWGFCPASVADVLNRVRGPFNVSLPAQAAAAAALRDKRHLEAAVEHNETWKTWLTDHIRKLGLRVDDSVANFILIHFPASGAKTARAANEYMSARGCSLRGLDNYSLPNCLRLTIGSEKANRRVVELLSAFMSGDS